MIPLLAIYVMILFGSNQCVRKKSKGEIMTAPDFHSALEQNAKSEKSEGYVPDRIFLKFEQDSISYLEMNQRANRIAHALLELGAEPGSGLAIMLPNIPEFLEVFFATQKISVYAVPVNTGLKGRSLAHVLSHSEVRFLVIHQDYLEEFQAIQNHVPELKTIVVHRDVPPAEQVTPGRALAYELLSDHPGSENPNLELDPQAICLIMYTSGTTGPAKGVVYRYNRTGLDLVVQGSKLIIQPGDIIYTCLPLFHMNALFLSTQWAIHSRNTLALGRRFSASRFWEEIRGHRATVFNALGAMIPILLKQPRRSDDSKNPVRLVFSAACPAKAWCEFEERFSLKIWELYGAVDGGTFSCINVGNAPVGSIGKPGVEHRLVDEDDNDCPPGTPGELIFRITNPSRQTVEYFKDQAETRKKMSHGWLRTGDLFYRDEQGFLYFVDRKTDGMRRRGENVSAFEVESAVCLHPDVLECAATGVPSDLSEDDIFIAVVPKPGVRLEPQDLYLFLEKHLAFYQLPRYIEIMEALPKTPTQKVQKSLLKQRGPGPEAWDRDKAS